MFQTSFGYLPSSTLSSAFDLCLYLYSSLPPASVFDIFYFTKISTLPGQDTAVDERHYGPDWCCGTLLGQAPSWAKYTAPITALGSPVLC